MLLLQGYSTSAQVEGRRYFPETGLWVNGEFLEYYERNPNHIFIYGWPITNELIDPETGLVVQYFQRTRLEYHPENEPGNRIVQTPLGELTYPSLSEGKVIDIEAHDAVCSFYNNPDLGTFKVCFSFLNFFETHGGVNQFGYPVSGVERQGNRFVQYFELARLEWHPEFPQGSRITISNLGEIYFWLSGQNSSLQLIDDNAPPPPDSDIVSDLKIRAFVESAVVSADDIQTLFVVVHNQYLEPVPYAQVTVVVKLPSGDAISDMLDPTNSDGITTHQFIIQGNQLGKAEVIVTVRHSTITETFRTSFRIWW
jgi:hypothetical protein